MESLRWKARIALLWVFMAVAISAHTIMLITEPGGLEWMVSEAQVMGTAGMVLGALFWLVPLWLAFLSMTLKHSANRWTNLVLGIIFTIWSIIHLFEPCVGSRVEQWLIIGSTVVVAALIAWYAWKWPKQEA